MVTPGLERIARRKLQQHAGGRHREHATEIRNGEFNFLGSTRRLGPEACRRDAPVAEASRLWRFQFAYQEWLLDLAANEEPLTPAPSTEVWQPIQCWMETWRSATEREAGDEWHPFCISRRLPVWLVLWAWRLPPADLRREIAQSAAAQAAFLSRRLELDLGGNHLLENLRALSLAAVSLRGSESARWLKQVRDRLPRELAQQILESGEHFERSPMYHCHMLNAVLDMRDVLAAVEPELHAACAEAAAKMSRFLGEICHPDGEIPLLGDSVLDDAPAPVTLELPEARGRDRAAEAHHHGSTWTYRNGDDFLLFDAGPVGPDHLPAHAHADLLTIEASIGGRRCIVDTGVFDYEDGAARRYCRSTAAHNVLEIDGENQCDVWSRFRMGRRGWPSPLCTGRTGKWSWASATHNAYRHLGIEQVGRWIGCSDESWLILDWAFGRGSHALTNRLHLHPEVEIESHHEDGVELRIGGRDVSLRALGTGSVRVNDGWYSPEFGVRHAIPVVEHEQRAAAPVVMGWCLAWQDGEAPQVSIERGVVKVSRLAGVAGSLLTIDARSGGVRDTSSVERSEAN